MPSHHCLIISEDVIELKQTVTAIVTELDTLHRHHFHEHHLAEQIELFQSWGPKLWDIEIRLTRRAKKVAELRAIRYGGDDYDYLGPVVDRVRMAEEMLEQLTSGLRTWCQGLDEMSVRLASARIGPMVQPMTKVEKERLAELTNLETKAQKIGLELQISRYEAMRTQRTAMDWHVYAEVKLRFPLLRKGATATAAQLMEVPAVIPEFPGERKQEAVMKPCSDALTSIEKATETVDAWFQSLSEEERRQAREQVAVQEKVEWADPAFSWLRE